MLKLLISTCSAYLPTSNLKVILLFKKNSTQKFFKCFIFSLLLFFCTWNKQPQFSSSFVRELDKPQSQITPSFSPRLWSLFVSYKILLDMCMLTQVKGSIMSRRLITPCFLHGHLNQLSRLWNRFYNNTIFSLEFFELESNIAYYKEYIRISYYYYYYMLLVGTNVLGVWSILILSGNSVSISPLSKEVF